MAPLLATLRLLVRLTQRELKGLSSIAFNNLFFCVAFLVQGSHNSRSAFFGALPFLIVLVFPVLIVMCVDTLRRFPPVRMQLWPLNRIDSMLLRIASLAVNPAFWLLGGGLTLWVGAAFGLSFLLVALVVQSLVSLAVYGTQRQPNLSLMKLVPAIPGPLGKLLQVNLRQILTSLDFYAAVVISVAATTYQFASFKADRESFPILAILVAVTVSTYAQRAFGLETPGSMARYRLLPIKPWRVLLAKDVAYLVIIFLLTITINLLPAVTFSLIALAVGRYPSLQQSVPQKPWRFTAGNPVFGVLQIVLGGVFALGAVRTSIWFLPVAFAIYLASLAFGTFWWKHRS